MALSDLALWIAVAVGGVVAGTLVVRGVWRAIGAYRVHKAGPRRLHASHHRIWRDPGAVEALDLVHGPGGPDGAGRAVQVPRRARQRLTTVPLGARPPAAPLADQVGTRGAGRNLRGAPGVGVRVFRRDHVLPVLRVHSRRARHDDAHA